MSSAAVVNGRQSIEVMHGDISQFQREITLRKFREGKVRVLVATDVASRGLDIPEVELVIQMEPPQEAETYIHRSGRTARAGRDGKCITFYSKKNEHLMEQIEAKAGIKFEIIDPPSEKEILGAKSPSVLRVVTGLGSSFDQKEHLQDARELLKEYAGDTLKVICRLVACLKEQMSSSSKNSGMTQTERPYNAPLGKENRGDVRDMNGYRSAHNAERPKAMGRGHNDGQPFREGLRATGSGRGSAYQQPRAVPDGFSSGPGSYSSTPYAGHTDSMRSTPGYNQFEDAPIGKSGPRNGLTPMNAESAPCKIFMGNLHYEMTEQALRSLFADNGLRVTHINLLKDPSGRPKGIGFAEFATPRDADYAVHSLNGFLYKGRPVRFEFPEANHQNTQKARPAERPERPERTAPYNGPSHHGHPGYDDPAHMSRGRGRGIMAR